MYALVPVVEIRTDRKLDHLWKEVGRVRHPRWLVPATSTAMIQMGGREEGVSQERERERERDKERAKERAKETVTERGRGEGGGRTSIWKSA